MRAYLNRCFGGNCSSFARGLLLVNDSWIFALFSSFPVLASAVCLCCCHFDMSNPLVASLFFTHLCLFYFVFSCCCFDKPRTSFVCSVDYVKLDIFKMVDVLTFHYLRKSEAGVSFPVEFFSNLRFPTLWCGIKPLDHEDVAQKTFWFYFVPLELSFGCSVGDETT